MFTIHREEINWGGTPLIIETGHVARQADGAVMITYGDTTVLCTAVSAKKANPALDFFPLTVHYQERFYATGRIPGGFFKREGRPSEKETLTSRLIDRPIRPLFAEGFKNETQILTTVVSHDRINNPDIPALIGASAALTLSGVPFLGPIGAARVGYKDGEYILNPSKEDLETSSLELMLAGTKDGVLMVESEASELSEEIMLGAVKFGHEQFQPVIDAIIRLAEKAAKDPWDLPKAHPQKTPVQEHLAKLCEADLRKAYGLTQKTARQEAIAVLKTKASENLVDADNDIGDSLVSTIFKKLEQDIVRTQILETSNRIDGRDTKTVRPILSEVGILSRTHGSALFTRGETQALAVTTLGTGQDEQMIDAIDGEYKERVMLHYNFPPYSVGEVGRVMSPGRREIGHGKLAWRSLMPVLPTPEDFPYTIRVVSEITESNGSSSMATVCGATLAMMDAGVPLKHPVAGIAMGLIKEGEKFAVLSDILGDEDHLGDMDFKVAGSEEGITSLQMDIKITGITLEIMEIALAQAKDGRLHILEEMSKALTTHRDDVGEHAPRIETLMVPQDKIRDVIGTGGKVIRDICETTGAKVDISDDGTVKVSAVDKSAIDAALKRIKDIVVEPEVGQVYRGKVVKIMDFGAFVNFLGARDGLVHISELAQERVEKVTDITNEGEEVYVQLVGFDRGKPRLSMKVVDQETGEPIAAASTASNG
ncbi:MAG: polyribonucleotide nucleotidyltransferase [bacterium]|nr:polyribonucleotide nucleotidyltransferase [bacterium]